MEAQVYIAIKPLLKKERIFCGLNFIPIVSSLLQLSNSSSLYTIYVKKTTYCCEEQWSNMIRLLVENKERERGPIK